MSMSISQRITPSDKQGFTIIELLIAALVFSMVLILITLGVIRFNQAYYKGVTQSNTQSVARSIIENISQAVQFSGGAVTSPIGTAGSNGSVGFCVGDQRYSYLPGWELSSSANAALHQSIHALVTDSPGDCSGMNAQNIKGSPVGTELLSPNMRLATLSVASLSGSNNLYKVDVRVVYGDDGLLCSPSEVAGSCTANATMPTTLDFTYPDLQCKSQTGSQFCGESELSTIVQKRIN